MYLTYYVYVPAALTVSDIVCTAALVLTRSSAFSLWIILWRASGPVGSALLSAHLGILCDVLRSHGDLAHHARITSWRTGAHSLVSFRLRPLVGLLYRHSECRGVPREDISRPIVLTSLSWRISYGLPSHQVDVAFDHSCSRVSHIFSAADTILYYCFCSWAGFYFLRSSRLTWTPGSLWCIFAPGKLPLFKDLGLIPL